MLSFCRSSISLACKILLNLISTAFQLPRIFVSPHLKIFFFVVIAFQVSPANAEDDFDHLIKKLEPSVPTRERVLAAQTMIKRSAEKEALKALAVLTPLTSDTNDDVRYECILLKLFILNNHKRKCPIEVFKWMKDPVEKIRINVPLMMKFFKKFPDGFLEKLIHFFDTLNPDDQADYLTFLVEVGGKDERVLQRINAALDSQHAGKRHNGTVAIWKATHDVQLVVPIYLKRVGDAELLVDFHAQKKPKKKFPLKGKHAIILVQLGFYGIGSSVHDLIQNHQMELLKSIRSIIDTGDAKQQLFLIRYIQFGLAIGAKDKKDGNSWFNVVEMTPLLPSLKELSAIKNAEISDLAKTVIQDIEARDDKRFLEFLKRYEHSPQGEK